MKTLYLHIGTPKTGTTSLQHFFRENQELLRIHGFDYPDFPYKYRNINEVRNGHFLVGPMVDSEGNKNPEEDKRIFREGMDRIRELFRKYDNLILSDEGIWTKINLNRSDVWDLLKKESEDGDYQIKVIVYLRRQDAYASSWWNQKVKIGRRRDSATSWEDFISREVADMGLDYYQALKKIGDTLGAENVIVRRFGRQYFKNHSIYEDFFEVLGLEFTDDYVIEDSVRNESINGNALEIKRILNALPNLEPRDNVFLRDIMAEVSAAVPENKELSLFSEEEARAFLAKFQEGNQKIMKEFLGQEGDLFDMSFKKKQKWEPDCSSMERDMIIFMGNIAMEFRAENELLRNQMEQQEKELNRQKYMLENMKNKLKHPVKTVLGRDGK